MQIADRSEASPRKKASQVCMKSRVVVLLPATAESVITSADPDLQYGDW